jgi:hypothetical protein
MQCGLMTKRERESGPKKIIFKRILILLSTDQLHDDMKYKKVLNTVLKMFFQVSFYIFFLDTCGHLEELVMDLWSEEHIGA